MNGSGGFAAEDAVGWDGAVDAGAGKVEAGGDAAAGVEDP